MDTAGRGSSWLVHNVRLPMAADFWKMQLHAADWIGVLESGSRDSIYIASKTSGIKRRLSNLRLFKW